MVTEAGDKGRAQLIKHDSLQESSFHVGIAGYISNQPTVFKTKITTLISLLLPGKQQKQTMITKLVWSQILFNCGSELFEHKPINVLSNFLFLSQDVIP